MMWKKFPESLRLTVDKAIFRNAGLVHDVANVPTNLMVYKDGMLYYIQGDLTPLMYIGVRFFQEESGDLYVKVGLKPRRRVKWWPFRRTPNVRP